MMRDSGNLGLCPANKGESMFPNDSCGAAVIRAQLDRAKPPSAEVKNGWSQTSAPPTCLQGRGEGHLHLHVLNFGRNASNKETT